MFKHLLTLAAVASMTLSASALELSLEDLNAGWGSTYDPETKTITFEDAWTGHGWGWWEEVADLSDYTHVVIEIEPTAISAQLVVQYKTDTEVNETSGFCDPGTTQLKLALNEDLKKSVQQIYIQCGANPGTITLKSAQIIDKSNEAPDPVIWTGNYTASGWNAGASISKADVKVGDILHYSMTPGDSETAQVIIKGADWSNLIGTAKITNTSIIDGVVEVVVTEQMLEACGGNIFLQGDGGITCTKIEIVGELQIEEDDVDALVFGTRILPVELYTNLPDNYKYLGVILDKMPEWIQLCNSAWTALVELDGAIVVEDEDGVLVAFPIDADIIAAINENSSMVLNGDTSVQFLGIAAMNDIPGSEDDYIVGLLDNTTPWWSAFSNGLVLEGNGTIHFGFYNYSDMVENWDNWLIVFTNSGLTPIDEGYDMSQELVVLRADNYGWGALFGSTVLENNYDWDTFKTDMDGAYVDINAVRDGKIINMTANVTTVDGKEYLYSAAIDGVESETVGAFLTVEKGHLLITEEYVDSEAGINTISQDNNMPTRIFNLNGIEINGNNLPAGIYIIQQGNKTSKVIVR